MSSLFDLMYAPATILNKKSVHVIGECTHDCFVMHGMCCAPSILAVMYLVSPWYTVPSFHESFSASLNCSTIHLR